MTARFVLLVVAKAPVPGLAKTRLSPPAPMYRTPTPSATIPMTSTSRMRIGILPPRSMG